MQFPESWLREFCNPQLNTSQLADTLTMAGLEVEDLQPVAPPFTKVVVGEIKGVQQHPNADRLRVCQVDVGQTQDLQIVCGAPNARVGIKVPCALVGAELPAGADGKPLHIKLGQLRGVESQGMLCSAKELHLSDAHEGLLELSDDATAGQDIRTHLNLDDTLFTFKLTPNLAHCLSVYGVARELSALTGEALCVPQTTSVPATCTDKLPVEVKAPDLCGRFSGRVIKGVNPKAPSPAWMVERLARCGQRSVSALVDISNYVMFELGQPTHIFDLSKIHGPLQVRWARAGEQLKLLNGNTVALDEQVGVIADDAQVESLAGIMGGDASAVSDDTHDIYVEAAFWWPKSVAGRSRRYNFSTDAGHRFERGVDPALTVEHIERITKLILDICGSPTTLCGPVDDQQIHMPESKPVTMRVQRAQKILGMPLSVEQCALAFTRLGFGFVHSNTAADNANHFGTASFSVTPPSWRFDLQIEEDLIEEIARMVGYDHFPHSPPQGPITAKTRPEHQRSTFAVRRLMAGMGYQETINFSFVDERWERELAGNSQPIRLINPIASQMGVMRSSLLASLVQVLKYNQDRKVSRVRVFELGRVFTKNPQVQDTDSTVAGIDQPMHLAGLVSGPLVPTQWSLKDQAADFFDVKADVEALLAPLHARFESAQHPAMHPGRCARIVKEGQVVGHLGELHPKWRQSYGLNATAVMFEVQLNAVLQRQVPQFAEISKHQPVERDLAVVVKDAVTHSELMAAIASTPHQQVIKETLLFDVYKPAPNAQPQTTGGLQAGEKSMAIRLKLQAHDQTLTDDQIDDVVRAVIQQLEAQTGARLRG
ncbi:MAG: phenylalanine--tRNA ligase subunit beta [Betaproteobacteria bacterium]|nr:phenylalanine--tRNA ligase subunit beta [Betaproteobacteria bacterium]